MDYQKEFKILNPSKTKKKKVSSKEKIALFSSLAFKFKKVFVPAYKMDIGFFEKIENLLKESPLSLEEASELFLKTTSLERISSFNFLGFVIKIYPLSFPQLSVPLAINLKLPESYFSKIDATIEKFGKEFVKAIFVSLKNQKYPSETAMKVFNYPENAPEILCLKKVKKCNCGFCELSKKQSKSVKQEEYEDVHFKLYKKRGNKHLLVFIAQKLQVEPSELETYIDKFDTYEDLKHYVMSQNEKSR